MDGKKEPYTTSEIIAECAEVQHHTVTRLLRNHKERFTAFGFYGFEIHKLDGKGRPKKVYRLNEQQATLELESEERDREKISASAEISKYYQSRIGVIDGVQYQQLMDYHTQDKLELDLIKLAIDKAADNGKRSFGYVNTILKNWTQNGIKTVAQQDEEQQRYIADKGHAQKTASITDPFGGNLG